jgi:AbrB family looped-hinge helix DNA binding protein
MSQRRKRSTGLAEQKRGYEPAPGLRQKVELGPGGRVVIPAPMRAALGMKTGDKLVARLEGNEVRIYTMEEALRRAQAIVRSFVPEGVSLVDELIAERRREAAKESE